MAAAVNFIRLSEPEVAMKVCLLTLCLVVSSVACGSDSKTSTSSSSSGCPSGAATSDTFTAIATAGGYPGEPNACASTMYSKYGASGFSAANANIIALALNPNTPNLGTSFQTKLADANSTRQAEFTSNLGEFLTVAFSGGTAGNYTGPSMETAHGDLAITQAQYLAFITEVVVPGLENVGVAASDVSNCFAPTVLDPNFTATIVTCK